MIQFAFILILNELYDEEHGLWFNILWYKTLIHS
jgi:hypothetical protein